MSEEEEQILPWSVRWLEKMAHLVAGWLAGYPVDDIYRVGVCQQLPPVCRRFRHATGKRVIQARSRCW